MMFGKRKKALGHDPSFDDGEARKAQVHAEYRKAHDAYVESGDLEAFDAAFLTWAWVQPITPLRECLVRMAHVYADAMVDRQVLELAQAKTAMKVAS